jgi:glyoxylase-like metal-dependent hydrolase (beta-lactamase superfamily II)
MSVHQWEEAGMGIEWVERDVGYHPGVVNVGVVRLAGDRALLVDSGLDDDRARKVLRALRDEGLTAHCLLLTHSHADHMGGGSFLRGRGLQWVAATPLEASLIRTPYLEPFYLYGGAAPPRALLGRFLMGRPMEVDEEVSPGPWRPPDAEPAVPLIVLALPGHSPGQCGLRAGGVVFCGDALFAPQTWEKHGLAYFADVGASLAAIDALVGMDASALIGGHCAVLPGGGNGVATTGTSPAGNDSVPDRIGALAATNREGLQSLSATIDRILRGADPRDPTLGLSTETLLDLTLRATGARIPNLPEYYLARATVQAHLTYLQETGRARLDIEAGCAVWRAASG